MSAKKPRLKRLASGAQVTLETLRERCLEMGECWEWQGCMANGRVPQVRYFGKVESARRVVYQLSGRRLRRRWFVVPECGNTRCINPAHLKQVTATFWMGQMGAQGKQSDPVRSAKIARVQREQRGKITLDDARHIRLSDAPTVELAQRYAVSGRYINKIRRGEAWRELDSSNPFAALMR